MCVYAWHNGTHNGPSDTWFTNSQNPVNFEFQNPYVIEINRMTLGMVISVCSNMCLPLGKVNRPGIQSLAAVPIQLGEVKLAQLQT